jgi:H+-translocating NAD(P) transhydrogenase subunit alpha
LIKIAVAKEVEVGERRVALVPDMVARLVKQGHQVQVETGAGERSHFSDTDYEAAGASIVTDAAQLWAEAEVVVKINPLQERENGQHELDLLSPGAVLIGFLDPLGQPDQILRLAERGITAFSMEMIPRTSRAQGMDALSSQAGVAGYQATLLAAAALPRFFPMLTTAAGTIPPAKVFVIGAGVAGLQAIATSRRLGAMVEAFDIRPAVKEEVQSLGAKFVEVPLEEETVATGGYAREVSEAAKLRTQAAISAHVKTADVVITTAQVPGKTAPILVTSEMVAQMKPGSVIVDLAAEQGGNCALTAAGKDVVWQGVTIIGPINLPASLPIHASQMYAKNVATLLQHLSPQGDLVLNFEDDITDSACLTHGGELRNPQVKLALESLSQPLINS